MRGIQSQGAMQRKSYLLALVAASLTIFSGVAVSAEDEAPLLDTVEVNVPKQADRSKSVSFLNEEDFTARRFSILNDILFFGIPGVFTSRANNTGAFNPAGGFVIRGFGRSNVSVYVDGIPSQATNHFHPISSQYSPDLIDRVEVYRSPNGVADGPNSSGSLHIFTPSVPREGVEGYANVLAGSFGTQTYDGRVGTGWGSGGIYVGGQVRDTNGIRSQGVKTYNANTKITQDLSDLWSADLRLQYSEAVLESSVSTTQDPDTRRGSTCFCTSSAVLAFDRTAESNNSTLAVYVNDYRSIDVRDNNGNLLNQETIDEREYGVRSKHTWSELFAGNSLTVGFDWVRFFGSGQRVSQRTTSDLYSPYALASQSVKFIGNQETVFNAGVRGNFSSDYADEYTPEVGLVHHVDRTLALRVNASSAYQIPRFQQLQPVIGGDTNIGNDDLDPANFYTEEIGVNKTFKLFDRNAVLDVVGFLQQGDNLFELVPVGANQVQFQNSGSFDNKGVETTFDYEIAPGVKLSLAEAYLSLEANPELNAAVAEQTFDASIDYTTGPLRMVVLSRKADQVRVGGRAGGAAGQRLDDFWGANFKIAYAFSKRFAVAFDVENVTDEEYSTFRANAEQAGRGYFVSFRYDGEN